MFPTTRSHPPLTQQFHSFFNRSTPYTKKRCFYICLFIFIFLFLLISLFSGISSIPFLSFPIVKHIISPPSPSSLYSSSSRVVVFTTILYHSLSDFRYHLFGTFLDQFTSYRDQYDLIIIDAGTSKDVFNDLRERIKQINDKSKNQYDDDDDHTIHYFSIHHSYLHDKSHADMAFLRIKYNIQFLNSSNSEPIPLGDYNDDNDHVIVNDESSQCLKGCAMRLGVAVATDLYKEKYRNPLHEQTSDERVMETEMSSVENERNRDTILVFMEPEKYPFLPLISSLIPPLSSNSTDIIIPSRCFRGGCMESLPVEQYHEEVFANLHFHNIIKTLQKEYKKQQNDKLSPSSSSSSTFPYPLSPHILHLSANIDWMFGPILFSLHRASHYFIDSSYTNTLHMWEAQMLPPIVALGEGRRVVSIEIPYYHPAEQKDYEEGNAYYSHKRLVQLPFMMRKIERALVACAIGKHAVKEEGREEVSEVVEKWLKTLMWKKGESSHSCVQLQSVFQ